MMKFSFMSERVCFLKSQSASGPELAGNTIYWVLKPLDLRLFLMPPWPMP